MKSNQYLNPTDVIFLLGAGASVDAGMPTVADLTKKLKDILHELPDVNGSPRPEFRCLFERVAVVDPSVKGDYERFFEWLYLLNKVQKAPFRELLDPKIPILEISGELSFVIGDGIKKILESVQTKPAYLSGFADFIPEKDGRLKIFSLNYDCCLEDACRSKRINITTGFDPQSKKWNPNLFKSRNRGINLYKLHGSLCWFGLRDNSQPPDQFKCHLELMELNNEDRQSLPAHFTLTRYPELILGPGTKIQPDGPYITMFYEFHIALRQAKICVIIGYGYRDEHVNEMLDKACDNGLSIVDINPTGPNTMYLSYSRYRHLGQKAEIALTSGLINGELQGLLN